MRLLHAWSTTLCPCILVVLGACADSDSDVRHVSTLPILTLHEDLRIGSAEDPDSGFSRIAAAEIGPDSSLYVLESMANEVRIFDYHGRRVGTIGRAGAGPGEFRLLGRLGFAGDTHAGVSGEAAARAQEREFYPVGADRAERTEARMIAATHRNLENPGPASPAPGRCVTQSVTGKALGASWTAT
jgi:hypothetical protein